MSRGGARKGAGRKPKANELALIEQMDAVLVPGSLWKAIAIKCKEGDVQAQKLWASYRFGLPKQQIDHTTNGKDINWNEQKTYEAESKAD